MDETNLQVNTSYGDGDMEYSDQPQLLLFILWGIILPLIAGVGVVGNVLTMVVLWRREMQSSTILYLRALVVTDTGILIAAVICLTPISCAQYLESEALQYFKERIYPLLHTPGYYLVMSLQQTNVWITVAVSVERYIAICHPFRAARLITRRKTMILLAAICIISFIYNIPHLFATYARECQAEIAPTSLPPGNLNLNHSASEEIQSTWTTSLPGDNSVYNHSIGNASSVTHVPSATTVTNCLEFADTDFGRSRIYTTFRSGIYGAVIYFIPFLALLVLNSFLIKELMVMQKKRSGTNINDENEANLSLVLVLIVVVFIFCQTPGMVSQFEILPKRIFNSWLAVSNVLFVTNSAVNFLIYTAFGRRFRKVLLRVIRHFYGGNTMASASSYRGWQYTNNDCEMSTAADLQRVKRRSSELTVLCKTNTNKDQKAPKTNGHTYLSHSKTLAERKPLCDTGSSSQDPTHKTEEGNGETKTFNEE